MQSSRSVYSRAYFRSAHQHLQVASQICSPKSSVDDSVSTKLSAILPNWLFRQFRHNCIRPVTVRSICCQRFAIASIHCSGGSCYVASMLPLGCCAARSHHQSRCGTIRGGRKGGYYVTPEKAQRQCSASHASFMP